MPAPKAAAILAALTLFTLSVFAANSIFCRAALVACGMGPYAYTAVRSLSAALILALLFLVGIIRPLPHGSGESGGAAGTGSVWKDAWNSSTWKSGLSLFAYMFCFSLGYVAMPAAPGTLVLNLCVQFAMIGYGVLHGLYPNRKQYLGLAIATAGLVILLMPGLTAPPLWHSLLMAAAGFAWGAYTVCGRGAKSAPLACTGSFWRAAILGVLCAIAALCLDGATSLAAFGFALAGGLASSLGYILWYAIVPRYSLIGASIIQLAVPIITAIFGALFLAEGITMRLVAATALILGGICLALTAGAKRQGA